MSFFPVSVPTTLQLLQAKNNTKVILDGTINDVITTIPVIDTTDIPTAGFLTFEDGTYEVIEYTGVTPTTLTGVTRGADGTTASSHANGTGIGMWDNAQYHNILSGEIGAICQNLSDRMGLHGTRIILQDYLDANSKKISGLAAGTVNGDALRYEQLVGVYLPLAGGTMAGNIAMGGTQKLTGLVAGSTAGDSVRYEQVLLLAGGTMTGAILLTDGAVGTPSLSFGTDPNTGIFSTGADRFGISLGGVKFAEWVSTSGLQINSGTVTNPSLSFLSDPNTGFYLFGADNLGFSANGINMLQLTSDAVYPIKPIWNKAGAVATPPYSFDGDTNTGIYSVGADSIGFSAGGVLIATINSSGLTVNSGILSATVQFPAGSAAAPSITFTGDINTGFFSIAADTMGISAGGVLQASIDGTNFSVVGRLRIADGTVASPAIQFTSDTNTGIYLYAANQMAFVADGVIRFYATPSGFTMGTGQLNLTDGSAASPSLTFASDSNTGIYSGGADILSFSVAGSSVGRFQAANFQSDVQFQSAAGTLAAPAYAFTGDTNSGMYLAGGDDVRLGIGGVISIIFQAGGTYSNKSINSNGPASFNLGDAANYWNDVSYKTLTDRGCLPWCDDGVELGDGRKVSDLEALCQIGKHPTKKTVHGLPMLDYKSFPKKAYRKAEVNGRILERDNNDEPISGSDGIEMTMMFGVFIGAFKEINNRLEALEEAA